MMSKIRYVLLSLAMAALAGCGGDGTEGTAGVGSDDPTTSTADAAVSDDETGAGTEDTAQAAADAQDAAPASFVADAPLFTDSFSPIDAGTYRVDTLGTPFSFTSVDPMFVQPNGRGMFVITHPGSNGPDDRDIVLLRLSGLSDPAALVPPAPEAVSEWPADDFDGWLDNLTNGLVASNRQATSLGGLPATFVELEVGDADCRAGIPCTLLGTNNGIGNKALVSGSKYRIWMVDQGDQDPLAVVVGVNREADIDWFDTADDFLATLAFDAVGPNPVFEADGSVELSFLGGIRTELVEPAIVVEESGGFGSIGPAGQPGDAEFLIGPNDRNGNAVETTDDLVTLLQDADVETTEIDPTSIGGLDARVFEIGLGRPGPPLLSRTPATGPAWSAPPRGRVWLVEHPERGLLVITAEAFAEPDAVFPVILAMTAPIVESMEFIDLG